MESNGPGGSGRELCWFPDPIGARDCYRAAHADPVLLHFAFPEVERITAKVSATRRDRLTARLPMLRPPHVGGNIGTVRVEVARRPRRRRALDGHRRGRRPDRRRWPRRCRGRRRGLSSRALVPPGCTCSATQVLEPAGLLGRAVAHGVTIQEFTGVARPSTW